MEKIENKKPRMDVMCDMETVSLKENAGLLSIALVPFRISKQVDVPFDGRAPFYCAIDLASCFMAGMDMVGCQEWWMKQDPKAISCILSMVKVPVVKAINEAYRYLSELAEQYELVMWSRGMDFDFPKLEWCFNKFVEKPLPYHYWNKRDVRTLVKEMGINEEDFEFEGVKHNSMDDCFHQIRLVCEAYRKIGLATNYPAPEDNHLENQ